MCKIVSVLLIGALFSGFTHYDYAKWHMLGKDAFLTHETLRFYAYIANPTITHDFAMGFVLIVIIGAYEGIATIIRVLTSRSGPNS